MNYGEEITQAISIGLAVATFLLNIGHALKAIESCKEGLVLLSNKAQRKGKQLCQLIHKKIYYTMFDAYAVLAIIQMQWHTAGDFSLFIAGVVIQSKKAGLAYYWHRCIGAKRCMLMQNNFLRDQSLSYNRLIKEEKNVLIES